MGHDQRSTTPNRDVRRLDSVNRFVRLTNGGATLIRFGRETTNFFTENLRWPIYRDAWALLLKSPLLGIGLGNFRSIFAFNRAYSALPNEAVHPESDWLWSTIELGWLGPVLILVPFIWWLRRCPPFEPGTARLLRVGAMICGCAFAVHGIFDVSGHRLGALWPALFLGSLAMHPHGGDKVKIHPLFVSSDRAFVCSDWGLVDGHRFWRKNAADYGNNRSP